MTDGTDWIYLLWISLPKEECRSIVIGYPLNFEFGLVMEIHKFAALTYYKIQ